MKNTVIIKGNRYGISIILNETIPFEDLLVELENKLESAEAFFDCEKQLAISFEGRTLSNEELDQILTVIDLNSNLKIAYILDNNSDLETTFYQIIQSEEEAQKEISQLSYSEMDTPALHDYVPTDTQGNGLFYKGTLKAGQVFETPESVIVIGDVKPGASVIAGGNIVVIGKLQGVVKAGVRGDKNAFVMALSMEPQQIEIDGIPANEHTLKRAARYKKESMIAIVIHNQICIDPISKSAIHDFYL